MDGGNAAGVAGAPDLHQVQGFAATHFADDHAVRPQAHRGPHQLGHRHDASAGAQRHMVAGCALQLDGVFEHKHAVARGGDLRKQGIGECGFAAARRPGDQDV